MDVGDPSNFDRILELYSHQWTAIKKDIAGASYTDKETRQTIKKVVGESGYICDPHGAVGYRALEEHLEKMNDRHMGFFIETAHPAKFKNIVEQEIGFEIEMPERLEKFLKRDKVSTKIDNSYDQFKDILLKP